MRLLLDTHLLLWAAVSPNLLSTVARSLMVDPGNQLVFSAASVWEVAIKSRLGRQDFKMEAGILRRGLLENDYEELSITSEHAVAVTSLPLIHGDPFDRILIAQSIVEGISLLTTDSIVAQYPGPIRKV